MIHPTLRRLAIPMLILATGAACAPVYSVPHGGHVRADTVRANQQVYRTRDGRVFPTRAARDAYLARIDAQDRELYQQEVRQQRRANRQERRAEREAQRIREERRLRRIGQDRQRAQQRRAEAERAERQARREARRTREARRARDQQQALAAARRNTARAEQAAIEAERRASRQARRNDRITRRQQRVDDLAPRPRLSTAVRQKVSRYRAHRRPGENVPAFVTRIADAERRSQRQGQTVEYWLSAARQRDAGGRTER